MKFSRRSFMKRAAMTAAIAPAAVPFVYGARARAATDAPVRFIGISNPHGTWKSQWRPRGIGGAAPTQTQFTFDYEGSILQPLEAWKHQLVVLDAIDYKVYTHNEAQGHEAGMITMLTGSFRRSEEDRHLPMNESVDQYLAATVGVDSLVPSLELGVYRRGGCCATTTMCFGPGGTRLPNEIDPAETYRKLFAGFVPEGEVDYRLQERMSVLDHVAGEVSRIQGSLPAHQRPKFERHLDSLRAIERRLGGSTAMCDPGSPPAMLDPSAKEDAPAVTQLQMDLIAEAFACDITRVATLQIFSAGGGPGMPWLGPDLDIDIHNGVAHRVKDGPEFVDLLIRVQQWYAEMFAYLLQALDVPDPCGEGTILDNTVIYWTNELGDPQGHRSHGIPTIVAGGGGGRINRGRYFERELPFCNFPEERPTTHTCSWDGDSENHFPHNQILTSICQVMGVDTDYFGDPRFESLFSGTLDGLFL